MVQQIDHQGDILAHIDVGIPFPRQKLRRLIDQIGRKDLVNDTVPVGFVKLVKTIGKETESYSRKHPARIPLLQMERDIQDGVTGGDHIVHDNNVPACNIGPEELMRDDGVPPVDHL